MLIASRWECSRICAAPWANNNFAGQYQQVSAPMGGGLVKASWVKTYTTQQFRGQTRVHESCGDEVDSHGRDFKRQVSGEGGDCSGDCANLVAIVVVP